METYLPIINGLLGDWLALTLNNPVYASVLASLVFFVTAILYGFRISSLKRKVIAREKAHKEDATSLNAALTISEQQLQAMQEVLSANNEQLKKNQHTAQIEAEKAKKLEEQLKQRNAQIADLIKSLSTRVDLGERPLPIMGDIKAEGLWQQHDRVVNLLVTKLVTEQQSKVQLQESYQVEKIKSTENEAVAKTLQATLAAQTSQLSLLEQALEDQKSILKVQQDKAQQVLAETIEKNNSELARIPELEKKALSLVNTQQELSELKQVLKAKEALIVQLESLKVVPEVKLATEVRKEEPKPISIKSTIEVNEAPVIVEKINQPVLVEPSHESIETLNSVKEETMGGLKNKFKGLFGSKNSTTQVVDIPKAIEVIPVVDTQPEPELKEPQVESIANENTVSLSGQFKKLFGKNNSKSLFVEQSESIEIVPVVVEPEPEIEPEQLAVQLGPVEVIKEDVAKVKAKLKGIFGKTTPVTSLVDPEPVDIEPVIVETTPEPVVGVAGKLKGLFGKKK